MNESPSRLLPDWTLVRWIVVAARAAAVGYVVVGFFNAAMLAADFRGPTEAFRWTNMIVGILSMAIQALTLVAVTEILARLAKRWDSPSEPTV